MKEESDWEGLRLRQLRPAGPTKGNERTGLDSLVPLILCTSVRNYFYTEGPRVLVLYLQRERVCVCRE